MTRAIFGVVPSIHVRRKIRSQKSFIKKTFKNLHKKDQGDVVELTITNKPKDSTIRGEISYFFEPFPNFLIWKAGLCLPNQPVENGTNVSLSEPIG